MPDVTRELRPLLDLLHDRWHGIRLAWQADVRATFPELDDRLDVLRRINPDVHEDDLRSGAMDAYLAAMRVYGRDLARDDVPFHALMHTLHLFEERCGDELRPELGSRPELWNAVSALDQVLHGGVAALAEGYFAELAASHHREMLAHLHDITATLNHEINTPLASIEGSVEMLLRATTDPRERGRLERIQRGARRIGESMRALLRTPSFTKTPYLSSVQIIQPMEEAP